MPSKLTQNITIKELQAQIEALKAELDKERRNNCVAYSELECLQTAVHFAYSVLERTVVWLRETISAAWPIVTLMFCKRSLPRALWQ